MATKQLIIEKDKDKIAIAYLEDKRLLEYRIESQEVYRVGNFYLGRVNKLLSSMNAAFLDIGGEMGKDGFLHYSDLSPNFHKILNLTKLAMRSNMANFDIADIQVTDKENLIGGRKGRVEELFKGRQFLLVQILKEPIGNKGPRLTCEFSLAGRHIIVRPFIDMVTISKKIQSQEERQRLKSIANKIRKPGFGIIIRTAAMNKSEKDILMDYEDLLTRWQAMLCKMYRATKPKEIYEEDSKSITVVRDIFSADFSTIAVNDIGLKNSLQKYLEKVSPNEVKILQMYSDNYPIMDRFGVTRQLKMLFATNVRLRTGAYLFIEKTEALHVIDVNSGNRNSIGTQEDNAVHTNIEAVHEIARQLRLRDLGGIIIVDFIDMKLPANKRKIYEMMIQAMKSDRAQHSVLPLSKFNIMQITRRRIRPEVNLDLNETCFACKGTGRTSPVVNMEGEIMKMLPYYLQKISGKVTICLHPFAYAYFNQGFIPKFWYWIFKFRRWIRIESSMKVAMNSFVFLDKNGHKIT